MTSSSSAEVSIGTDANAAKTTASRSGLGETRNIEFELLVGEMTNSGRVNIGRVPEEFNVARSLDTGKSVAWDRELDAGSWRSDP